MVDLDAWDGILGMTKSIHGDLRTSIRGVGRNEIYG